MGAAPVPPRGLDNVEMHEPGDGIDQRAGEAANLLSGCAEQWSVFKPSVRALKLGSINEPERRMVEFGCHLVVSLRVTKVQRWCQKKRGGFASKYLLRPARFDREV